MTKIALCLSGKIGNTQGKSGYFKSDVRVLEKSYEHYKKHIIDVNFRKKLSYYIIQNLQNMKNKYSLKYRIMSKENKLERTITIVAGMETTW